MTMTAACLLLAGCSAGGGDDDALTEALGWVGGAQDTERLSLVFVDVAGIHDTVGYSGDGTERSDPNNTDPLHQWGVGAARLGDLLFVQHPGSPQLLDGATMEWSIGSMGQTNMMVTVHHNTPDAATAVDRLTAEGWELDGDKYRPTGDDASPIWQQRGIQVTDNDIIVLGDGPVSATPDAERNARDDDRVAPLLDCLSAPT